MISYNIHLQPDFEVEEEFFFSFFAVIENAKYLYFVLMYSKN